MENESVNSSLFSLMSFQNHALNLFRTNNPILDGFISIIISALFAYVFRYFRLIKEKILFLCGQISSDERQFKMRIPEHYFINYFGTIHNADFNMIQWFVSDLVKHKMTISHTILSMNLEKNFSIEYTTSRENDDDNDNEDRTSSDKLCINHYKNKSNIKNHIQTYKSPLFTSYQIDYKNHKIKLSLQPHILQKLNDNGNEVQIEAWIISYSSPIQHYFWKKKTLSLMQQYEIIDDFMHDTRQKYITHLEDIVWTPKVHKFSNSDKNKKWISQKITNEKNFDNIVLEEKLQQYLINDIEQFINSKDWYHDLGLSYKRGYLLSGKPGTGKTSIIQAIANYTKSNIYMLDLSKFAKDEELELALEMLPEKCVLVFEEIDTQTNVVLNRNLQLQLCDKKEKKHKKHKKDNTINKLHLQNQISNFTNGKKSKNQKYHINNTYSYSDSDSDNPDNLSDLNDINKQTLIKILSSGLTLGCILNSLDGIGKTNGRITCITTNHPEKLDPALTRPGRIDLHLQLNYCTKNQIYRMFLLYYKNILNDDLRKQIQDIIENNFTDFSLSSALISSISLHYKNDPLKSLDELKKIQKKDNR